MEMEAWEGKELWCVDEERSERQQEEKGRYGEGSKRWLSAQARFEMMNWELWLCRIGASAAKGSGRWPSDDNSDMGRGWLPRVCRNHGDIL